MIMNRSRPEDAERSRKHDEDLYALPALRVIPCEIPCAEQRHGLRSHDESQKWPCEYAE